MRGARKLDDEGSLYEYAVRALGRRMRSVAELKRMMRRRVEPGEHGNLLIEVVIAKLKEQRYLNDASYAAAYSAYRKDSEKFGRMRVITDLKSRGVHAEVIDKAVTTAYEGVDEEKLARDYLRRKRLKQPSNQKETARIFRSLLRAGFRSKTIFTILKRWNVDDEVLTALAEETQE